MLFDFSNVSHIWDQKDLIKRHLLELEKVLNRNLWDQKQYSLCSKSLGSATILLFPNQIKGHILYTLQLCFLNCPNSCLVRSTLNPHCIINYHASSTTILLFRTHNIFVVHTRTILNGLPHFILKQNYILFFMDSLFLTPISYNIATDLSQYSHFSYIHFIFWNSFILDDLPSNKPWHRRFIKFSNQSLGLSKLSQHFRCIYPFNHPTIILWVASSSI